MGRTACTEPQCLYKGALYLTVELYFYSPYRPYGLYRASVPVQGCILPLPLLYVACGPSVTSRNCSHAFSRYPAETRTCPTTSHLPVSCRLSINAIQVKGIASVCSLTLTEVFPCFFLSCKANARVKPAKTGHGPHSS